MAWSLLGQGCFNDPQAGGTRPVDDFVSPGSGGLRYTHALTFDPDGNPYVVSDGSNEVKRYNGVTRAFIDTFASGAGMFDPKEAQFGPDGNLYVSTREGEVVKPK